MLANMLPCLCLYSSRQMAVLLYKGFSHGFRLPSYSGYGCVIVENLPSVEVHSDIIKEKIQKEIQEGKIAGPFTSPPFQNFRISPLGIIPKKEPNSFGLIHYLSYPDGLSLNDEISLEMCLVSYASFDDALVKIRSVGSSALLAKADIKSAFHLLPVHPMAFNSLGFYFQGRYYFDKCLPMGCSLSCKYFKLFSTFIEWVVSFQTGLWNLLHYLDDFLFIGKAGATDCIFLLNSRLFAAPLAFCWLQKSQCI